MQSYKTRQRDILISYLTEHTDEQLSARNISEALADEGISLSAVYRNLNSLALEGKISRITGNSKREAYYRYIGHCGGLLHLTCTACGRTVHMNMRDTQAFSRALDRSSGFKIDPSATVLYGLCARCSEGGNGNVRSRM